MKNTNRKPKTWKCLGIIKNNHPSTQKAILQVILLKRVLRCPMPCFTPKEINYLCYRKKRITRLCWTCPPLSKSCLKVRNNRILKSLQENKNCKILLNVNSSMLILIRKLRNYESNLILLLN